MNFVHTEDRRMLADTLNRYIEQEYGIEARNRIAYGDQGYSAAIWSQFAELGAIGALFKEADGGYGGEAFDIAVVFEALGRGLVVEPFLDAGILVGGAIARAGNAAQREHLEAIMAGSLLASLAHTEPASGYELARVETQAERKGDGWVLNGVKGVVTLADKAGLFLVSARTAGDVASEDGISLFLVPADAAGLRVQAYNVIEGGRAGEVVLEGVSVPADAMLAEPGRGYAVLQEVVGAGLLALCAEAVGAMDVARDATLEYLRTRKQFGVPIGSFQALQHRMADLLIEIEQARSAVINAAAAMTAPFVERERALSAAKYTIGQVGTRVAEECIQLHGGIGVTWELPLAHYAKRLVMIDHQLGDGDYHLERYVALASA